MLSLIIMLIKPSYLMNFVIAYPLYVLIFIKNKGVILKGFLLVLIIGILLFLQFIYVYYFLRDNLIQYQNVRIIISPLSAWKRISSNVTLSGLSWFLLPLSIFIFYFKQLINKKLNMFAFLNFIIGLVFFILLEEIFEHNNAVVGSVNFIWQLIISLYILSVISIAYVSIIIKRRCYLKMMDLIIFLVFLYYALGGGIYLFNTLFSKIIYD